MRDILVATISQARKDLAYGQDDLWLNNKVTVDSISHRNASASLSIGE